MYREGQTATHKDGRKIVYQDGQWRLMQGGGGVPAPPKLAVQEQQTLRDARSAASQFSTIADQAGQFAELNKEVGTGPIYKTPVLGGVFEAIGETINPKLAQLNALESRMAPAQREPGSGTTSDRDLALFLKAVPNTDRMGPANGLIADDMRKMANKKLARSAFLDAYARNAGTLMGSEDAFESWWAQNGDAYSKSRKSTAQGGRKPPQRGGSQRLRFNPQTGDFE